MNLTEKQAAVEELRRRFEKAEVGILTQLNGIDVATITELRKQLREAKVDYRVVKNSLAKRASKGTKMEAVAEDFTGPVGLAISMDPVTPAKVLTQFVKSLPPERADWLKIKSGMISGKRVDAAEVVTLSTLPGLPELRAKILGLLLAPAQTLARLLATPASQLARVLDAHARAGDLETSDPAVESEAKTS